MSEITDQISQVHGAVARIEAALGADVDKPAGIDARFDSIDARLASIEEKIAARSPAGVASSVGVGGPAVLVSDGAGTASSASDVADDPAHHEPAPVEGDDQVAEPAPAAPVEQSA